MKISIIIPVYNVKEYLSRCLDSIKRCKENNYEVLIIDDGSTDGSSDICDLYAEQDDRFHVIHKKNGGVSSARNIGLENAKGTWVFFVDADDYVDEMYLSIEDDNSDIIEKGYSVINVKDFVSEERRFESNSITAPDEIGYYFVNKRTNALWNKAFKRTIIGDSRFNENVSIGEDFLFILEIIKKVKVYGFSSLGNYFYCERSGSAMDEVGKDFERRINLIFDNIPNVKNLTDTPSLKHLRTGILYTTYAYYFHSIKGKLSKEDKLKMENLFCELSVSGIKYITIKGKIKMIVLHYWYLLKHFICN